MAVVLQVMPDVARITVPDGRSYTGDQVFVLTDASFALLDTSLIDTQLKVIGVGDDPDTAVVVDGLIIVQTAEVLGPQGFQGAGGTQGPQGTPGLTGNQGHIGAQGVQGTTGLQGPQGLNGTLGPQGFIGAQGVQGAQGSLVRTGNGTPSNSFGNNGDLFFDKTGKTLIGPKAGGGWDLGTAVTLIGPQGSPGVQGLQGSQGSGGTQGAQGNQGLVGNQGVQGNTGSQGPQGSLGTQGAQGLTGPQGTQGVQGTTGSQGAVGTQGNQGLRGFQGLTGAQGSQGGQGGTGVQGNQGNQGNQGTTGNQGSIGNDGPQGFQGVDGSAGLQGPPGVQGLQGSQGSGGPQGFQGSQGLQGLIGPQGNPVSVNGKNGPSINLYIGDVFANPMSANLGAAGAVVIDGSQGHFIASLSANATSSTFTNVDTNSFMTVTWAQDATGGRTYAWPSICRFAGGAAPGNTAANSRTTVTFFYDGAVAWEVSRAVGVL